MGAWGGDIQKPTEMISNVAWAGNLKQPLSAERRADLWAARGVQHLPMDQGNMKRRVSGANGLKNTQTHPPEYGIAVHNNWEVFGDMMPDDEDVSSDEELPWAQWQAAAKRCNWPELQLEELDEFAGIPTASFLH